MKILKLCTVCSYDLKCLNDKSIIVFFNCLRQLLKEILFCSTRDEMCIIISLQFCLILKSLKHKKPICCFTF